MTEHIENEVADTKEAVENVEAKEAIDTTEEMDAGFTPDSVQLKAKGSKFEETRKVIEERKDLPNYKLTLPVTTYMQPPFVTMALHEVAGAQVDTEVGSLYMPYFLHSQTKMSKGDWAQTIKTEDGKVIGPRAPRLRSTGGTLTGEMAVKRYRRSAGTGAELQFELIHSGFSVTMTPVNENRLIDFDFTLSTLANKVGLQTNGTLLSARSGIFSAKLVELAVEHIISSNLRIPEGVDADEYLLSCIDERDYDTLAWGLQATKTPNNHPWDYMCSNPVCDHIDEGSINFSRASWIDRSALSDKQLDILTRLSTGVTKLDLDTYRSEFKQYDKSSFTLDNGNIIELKHCSLPEYLASADGWCQELELQYNNAMRNYSNDSQRTRYLRTIVNARRMARYAHIVDRILIPINDIMGDDETPEYDIYSRSEEGGAEAIKELLIEMSGDSTNFSVFETAVIEFLDQSKHVVYGYPAKQCSKCGYVPKDGEDTIDTIVPIPMDRVFFTILQQKVALLAELPEQ